MLLRAWANFSDCGFSRRVFLFRQEFSFSQSYRVFFPSFCQALAEDRVTTPTKKKNSACLIYVRILCVHGNFSCCQETARSTTFGTPLSALLKTMYSESWDYELSIGICKGPIRGGGGWLVVEGGFNFLGHPLQNFSGPLLQNSKDTNKFLSSKLSIGTLIG